MPTRSIKKKPRRQPSWWLADEGGICSACGHPYAYQTESYCAACDAAVCAICVQRTITLEMICPGCAVSETLFVEVSS